jgi:hypothetical protein
MKMLSSQYAQFTPEERLRLALAAEERGDLPEVKRLTDSCPQMPRVVVPDPEYGRRVMWMYAAVSGVSRRWVEASALVLCHGMFVAGLPAKDVTLVAKVTANWKQWSAVWRGIESGITKFCADADLTGDQLLVLAGGRSAVVEQARGLLHDDACADRQCEDVTRQELAQAWQGGSDQ